MSVNVRLWIYEPPAKQGKEVFNKIQRIHHDQANFGIESSSDLDDKNPWMISVIGQDGSKKFEGYATTESVENAMSECGNSYFEKRLLDDNSSDDLEEEISRLKSRNSELKTENENLRGQLSEMQSQMKEMQETMQQIRAQQQESSGRTDTDDRLDEVFNEAGLDEPELGGGN